jgi:hypothetical protein
MAKKRFLATIIYFALVIIFMAFTAVINSNNQVTANIKDLLGSTTKIFIVFGFIGLVYSTIKSKV